MKQLVGSKINNKLPRATLENLIKEFMLQECMCVLATCSDDSPRASPVEFFPLGTTIYVLTEGGEKIDNITKNPRVSIAVHAPFTGWQNLRGLQIAGNAEVGIKGTRIFEDGTEAYRKRRGLESAHLPDFMKVIRIVPQKMEYIDTRLADEGFGIRQELVLQ